jgi:hypothetical protein
VGILDIEDNWTAVGTCVYDYLTALGNLACWTKMLNRTCANTVRLYEDWVTGSF